MRGFLGGLILTLALSVGSMARAADAPPPVGQVVEEPALEPGTIRFIFHSKVAKQDFVVEVTAPMKPVADGARLPVIYALDGGYGVAGPSARLLGFNFVMAPSYVVSVDFPGPWGPAQWALRNHDLLHRQNPRATPTFGGGGADFEKFLIEELRPYIATHFPVDDTHSILVGHSFGGLFAATILVHSPSAFWGYLIASPSLFVDPSLIGSAGAAASRSRGQRVFIGVGELEEPDTVRGAEELAHALTGPGSGMVVRFARFPGQDHMPSYLLLAPEAFPFLAPPFPAGGSGIALGKAALERYVGVYRLSGPTQVRVVLDGERLYADITGQPRVELRPESPERFSVAGEPLKFVFRLGPDGKPASIALEAPFDY